MTQIIHQPLFSRAHPSLLLRLSHSWPGLDWFALPQNPQTQLFPRHHAVSQHIADGKIYQVGVIGKTMIRVIFSILQITADHHDVLLGLVDGRGVHSPDRELRRSTSV